MMDTNIYLPIEIKRRELYSRIYFAIYASLKGYKVTIGRKTKFHDFCEFLEPGNYISKSLGAGSIEHLKKMKKLGHKVFYLNEEGLMSFNKEFTHRMVSLEGIELIDGVFTWGKNHSQEMMEIFPKLKTKFMITGNARFDILKGKAKDYYYNEVNEIKKKYDSFFLVTTKFAKINYIKRKNIVDYYSSQISKRMLPTIKLKEICKRSINHEKMNFQNLFIFLEKFSKEIPEKKIVILVHPGEDKNIYKQKLSHLKNVFIAEGDYSSNSWILSSDLVIQNNCTTSLEAFLLNKRSLQLNTFQDDLVEYMIPKKISKNFSNNENLISFLKKFSLKDRVSEEEINEIKKILSNYIENIDTVSSVDLTLEKLSDHFIKKNIVKPNKFLIKFSHKLKILIREIFNTINDTGQLHLAESKFSGLRLEDIQYWIESITKADNLKKKNFDIVEFLPGLFTIKYKERI